MSAATSSGLWPSLIRKLASFPAVVVFPDPWRPTIMIPDTWPLGLSLSLVSAGPIRASSSSWQILTKWSDGLTRIRRPFLSTMVVFTTSPAAFSRTLATNFLTTSNATSASSRETRMSRSDSSTSSGVISVFPWSLFFAARKPLLTVSSMGQRIEQLHGARLPGPSPEGQQADHRLGGVGNGHRPEHALGAQARPGRERPGEGDLDDP